MVWKRNFKFRLSDKIRVWQNPEPVPEKVQVSTAKSGNLGLSQAFTPRKAKHKGKQHVR